MADGAELQVRALGMIAPRGSGAPGGRPAAQAAGTQEPGAHDLVSQEPVAQDLAGTASQLLTALGAGMVLHDPVGRLRRLDAAAARILGVDQAAVLGRTWHDLAWGASHEGGQAMAGHEHPVMQCLADGATRNGVVVGLTGTGTGSGATRWVRFDVTALHDGSVAAMVTDVTQEVQQRLDDLREYTRSRRLLAPERDVVVTLDRHGRIRTANAATEDVLGRLPADLLGCSLVELVTPADRPAVQERFQLLSTDDVAVLRVRVRRRGGERRWTRLGMRWLDPDMARAHVVLADEHDAVSATSRAEELRERLSAVASVARDTVALHTGEGAFTWVSERASVDLGWEPEDLLGRSLHDLVHPEDVPRVDAAHGRSAAGEVASVRYRCRGADEQWRLVESQLSGVLDRSTGRLLELRSATRAAAEVVGAEQRLDAAEELFRRGFDTSPFGVALLGPPAAGQSPWRRVNDALVELLGRSRGSIMRLALHELLVEQETGGTTRQDLLAALDGMLAGNRDAWRGPATVVRGDATPIAVRVSACAVRTGDGVVHVLLHVVAQGHNDSGASGSGSAGDELTGLPDRWLVMDRLVNALQRATRTGQSVGVVAVVLDNFAEHVDRCGQAAGESVVVEAVCRIAATLRAGDTLGRVGENAFLIVCEDVHERAVSKLAARLSAAVGIAAPGTVGGHVTASVGCATRPCTGGQDPVRAAEALVGDAEGAAREVKLRGGGGWHMVRHAFD